MKINRKMNGILFSDLKPGEYFEYNAQLYIKTITEVEACGFICQAVNLATGDFGIFAEDSNGCK